MRYFFECGNFTDISLAELSAVFESYNLSKDSIKKISEKVFLIESNSISKEILDTLFYRLAGWIRYGEVIDDLDTFLEPYYKAKKVVFGISVIGDVDIKYRDIQKLSNDLKRNFRSNGISSRFLLPKETELNAAQIYTNDILKSGFELCIFDSKQERMYGNTLGIQDIYSYVKRDMDRPDADYEMGVLPQKLAHILCNLTALREGIIWDPFCGSGTVLMEAAVLGFDLLGSDIDLRAIDSAKRNIEWLSSESIISHTMFNIFQLDIRKVERRVVKDLKRTGISAVVCEPFMGTPQRRAMSSIKAQELLDDVRELYTSLFNILEQICSKGFKVVLIIPSYKTDSGWLTFNISELVGKRWDVLNRKYTSGDLKWERINSIISRNIFILEKR